MFFTYNDRDYEVLIEKKASNRNTYIRVKKDLKIHVTTSLFTSTRSIKKLISDNYLKICQMIDVQELKVKNNLGFFYLGKQYTVIYCDYDNISFNNDKVFIPHKFDIDMWYKKMAKSLFQEHFEAIYNKYSRNIPHPKLRIRKMTTRWGVCNIMTHIITLNLELIKRDTAYLDYVIVHEMAHLIYGDHSKKFWELVEENMPDYKKYREEMKEF